MNRNPYGGDYSVPSLSLSSSRSKRSIPTKDISEPPAQLELRPRQEVMDRINRPPLYSSKNIRESNVVREQNFNSYKEIRTGVNMVPAGSLSRNVYLSQQQSGKKQTIPTFRGDNSRANIQPVRPAHTLSKSPSFSLLRNPQSHTQVSNQMDRALQSKKVDVNKSLFDRKMKKLLQQAQFYDKQLAQMYPDNSQVLARELSTLEQYRNEALSFNFASSVAM